jgi:hypothetical protein
MNRTALECRFILFAAFGVFALLKTQSIHFSAGDENIYFYLADQVAAGAVPYRDFFHAHPPLHLTSLALANWASGGFSLLSMRLVAIASTVGAALLLTRTAPSVGIRVATYGAAVFLLSFDVLRLSTHPVGVNLAGLFVALAFERLARNKDLQAVIAFCCGGFTMLVAAPAAVGAALVLLFAEPKRGVRFIAYGGTLIVALNVAATALFGTPYLDQVYLFHFGKTAVGSTTFNTFATVAQGGGLLLATASMGVVALILGVRVAKQVPNEPHAADEPTPQSLRQVIKQDLVLFASIGGAVASILFLLFANRIFIYYFQVLFVCLVPLAGYGVAALCKAVRDSFDRSLDDVQLNEARLAAGVLLFLLLAGQFPNYATRGEHGVTNISQYLAHEADVFESAEPIAKQVSEHCEADATVFGDSTAAPLVALLADRTLTLGEADTNQMRFRSDADASHRFIERLEAEPPCAVVFREKHGVFVVPAFARWLDAHYTPAFETQNQLGTRRFTLFVRKSARANN